MPFPDDGKSRHLSFDRPALWLHFEPGIAAIGQRLTEYRPFSYGARVVGGCFFAKKGLRTNKVRVIEISKRNINLVKYHTIPMYKIVAEIVAQNRPFASEFA